MFKPELINSFKGYNASKFISDLIAGIVVGIVALPLAIAFGLASIPTTPETAAMAAAAGIFTAIIAGFCISAFGGSTVQIGGPTGAFAVIVYGIVAKFGMPGLATATVLAGILLILLGAFKMGGLVKFIPYTIVTGFTAGIAVTIASGQIGSFFGLVTKFTEPMTILGETYEKMPGDFLPKMIAFFNFRDTFDLYTFIMAAICLAFIFIWGRFIKKIPGSLIVILVATVANVILAKNGFEPAMKTATIGAIPTSLPSPQLPDFSLGTIVNVFPSAISIAVLAAIESLLSAQVADGMTGDKHDSNTELIGQGIANIITPLFGGIPATGAIARTATNIKNGGRTPIAGIIHALTLLLVLLFLGDFASYIPMASLAAVLINVAWNMAGFPAIKALLHGQKSDICVFAVTFIITVFVDLTVAISVGLGLAAFFFIKKIIDVSEIQAEEKGLTGGVGHSITTIDTPEEKLDLPNGAMVYEIEGPLFFGTVRKFELAVERAGLGKTCKVLILRMRNTLYLDAGGIKALEQAIAGLKRQKITLVLSGVHEQPRKLLEKMGMVEKLGAENVCDNIDLALKRTKSILGN